ncbi:MAG: uracil-DNA glycosylase [Sedimentisphaerales bacterium]|jgi:DNA polymerase
MKSNPDIKKVIRQHAEMAEFFSGGLTVKKTSLVAGDSPASALAQSETGSLDKNESRVTSHEPRATVSAPASPEVIKELEDIAEQTRKCRKCELGSLRKNAVPGEGNTSARIMFVGEAPGADEDTQGRPFVGRAGQLLDKIITACGLKREDVWIGNILKCRPPDNRDPKPEEIIACIPYLQRQIELINPEIIVALGAHAAKTLLDTPKAIGQLRGIFHEYIPGIGHKPIKLMPTFHPAYLLRNYSDDNRRKVWEDMKKVLAELGLPVPQKTGR